MKKLKLFAIYSLIVFVSWGVYQNHVIGQAENVSDVHPTNTSESQVGLSKAYGKLPMHFEANQGQAADKVEFLSRGPGYSLFLTKDEAVLSLRKTETNTKKSETGESESETEKLQYSDSSHNEQLEKAKAKSGTVLRMKLTGANPDPEVEGVDELPGKSNYFRGNDPKKWRRNVTNYAKVKYNGVYPGIDLVYYGNQQKLEYDFVVAPGADPNDITLGLEGADSLNLDKEGNLILLVDGGEVMIHAPVIYQETEAGKQSISGNFEFRGNNRVGFDVDAYNASRPLVIDPELTYSTYLGGSQSDTSYGSTDRYAQPDPRIFYHGIAVDEDGSAYVTGGTNSVDFPTENPFQGTYGGGKNTAYGDDYPDVGDIFVTKLSPDGSSLIYSTYLGGIEDEEGNAIAVDAAGSAYVTGHTYSDDFPTANAFQGRRGSSGASDTFVTKLSPDGSSLVYSTYLGGRWRDVGNAIAVDTAGSAYVTGRTKSDVDFPTANPFQGTSGDSFEGDAFVTKLSPNGTSLVYSTYLGGEYEEYGHGIAVDEAGSAYVTGSTNSRDFPTENAFRSVLSYRYNGITGAGLFDCADAFVTKLSPDGTSLVYSTYLGGIDDGDIGFGIAVDAAGSAYVTGSTFSEDFPTENAFQEMHGNCGNSCFRSNMDAFVTKLSPGGASLIYSTYLGGEYIDLGCGIAVDADGSAYVTGYTRSDDFPTVNAFQGTRGGDSYVDAFVTKLSPDGSSLDYSTYLGGKYEDRGFGIAVDTDGSAYVTGSTGSDNFPTVNPFQGTNGGGVDTFVAKIGSNTIDLIYNEVTMGSPPVFSRTPTTPQQILPQFLLNSPDSTMFFRFEGRSTDGKVGLRVLNTRVTNAAFPPITLKVKIIDPVGTEIVPFSISGIRSGDVGKQFDVTQDGTYEVEVSADPSSPGPFPAPFQIHLAADAGLPRKLINGVPEVPRAIRQDILVNHTAPRPQGLFGQDSTTAQTALFKFVKRSEVSQFANAVIVPPSSSSTGFPLAQGIVRAPDPMNPLDITTPTARTPICEGGDPTGMVVDFTQIPDPALPGVTAPSLAGTVCAVIGENDATSVTLPLANGVTGLVLDMGSGQEVVDGDGVDFQVFSPAGNYTVAVSNTPYAGTFIPIGGTVSGTQSFDLAGTNLTSARFVLVTAASQVTLDAVKALNVFIDEVVSGIPVGRLNYATITMRRAKASETAIDPVLELIAPDGTLFGPVNDSGFGDKTSLDLSDAALIHKDLAQSGFYRFLARGYDQTPTDQSFGAFFVRLESGGEYDANDILVSETDEENTVVQKTGSISRPRERDSFIFQWHPGQSIKIVVNTTNGNLDPVVELHDPEGFLIAANDNFKGRGRNAVLDLTLPVNTFNTGAVSPELPDPSTYRLVVGAVDPMRGLNDKRALNMGTAYFRGAANGDYEVRVFTGDLAGGNVANPTAITPSSGIIGSKVDITDLTGTEFQNGVTVKLAMSGQKDIEATNVTFVSTTKITCTLNLTGVETGKWNVVVTNPGESAATLTDGFMAIKAEGMICCNLDGNEKDDIIVDFGSGIGIWVRMNNSTWVDLIGLSSEDMICCDLDGNGLDDIIVDFGPLYGIWIRMNNSTWVNLHGLSSEYMICCNIDGNGLDDIIVDFGSGIGTWARMNNSTWVKLHDLSPGNMICCDLDGNGLDDIIVDFGSPWIRMNNSTWVKLPLP